MRVALTIAGSDSGGGAGIQADLAAFRAAGVWGTSAVTCLTAQSPAEVSRVEAVEPTMVSEQIRVVCGAFSISAIKIGMPYSAPIIKAIANALKNYANDAQVVLDPVMRATSGASLLQEGGEEALIAELLPLADVVTPNLIEAVVLSGLETISGISDMETAAKRIAQHTDGAVIVKGGHLVDSATDVIWSRGEIARLEGSRVDAKSTHGTGCSFSSALAAELARGQSLIPAAEAAKKYVTSILERNDRP